MKTSLLLATSFLLFASYGEEVVWKNLDDSHRLGGRKVSDGYLRGKVVLVDRWGAHCPPCRALLPRLEEIWTSYKTKPFVLLGGHCRGWGTAEEVKSIIAAKKLTYPVYEDAGLMKDEPEYRAIPFLYLVDETGQVRYKGHSERAAIEQLVMLLTDMEAPKNVTMWKRFIDYELTVLPGRAFVRLTEFRKKFPTEGRQYDEEYAKLKKNPEVQKLVKLITYAKTAKDYDPKAAATRGKVTSAKIDAMVSACEKLKSSSDARIAQEAKNAIADLIWAKANL